MTTDERKSPYLTHTGLKNRVGWSDRVIAHFLPVPDTTRTNPHYRSAAPTKLYLLSKIQEVEARQEWQQQAVLTNRRKRAGALATATKRANLIGYVEGLIITVPVLEQTELIDLACAHYNARKAWRTYERGHDEHWAAATAGSDPSFIARITMNYLRHQLTRYEKELERIAGKVGVDDAYENLKTRVNEAIVKQYPFLETYYPLTTNTDET